MPAGSLESLATLGSAAVDADKMASIAAAALGQRSVELISVGAVQIPFPVFNMTTGGLWRVSGTAITPSAGGQASAAGQPGAGAHPRLETRLPAGFSTVVKLIQSPLLWAGIDQVPPSFRDALTRHYPWHTEADVYASSLAHAMPSGGRLPTVYCIEALDPQRTAIWMEDIPENPAAAWDDARYVRAATLLGRLAGSGAVRDSGPAISTDMDAARLRMYLDGFVTQVLVPAIRGEELWKIPAVAAVATAPLMAGLRQLTDRAYELATEIIGLPALPAHGDASPQNLLGGGTAPGNADFAVIDWGMYGAACVGFDLSQLLAGRANAGDMNGGQLYHLEPLCLAAYCKGLAESGADVPDSVVRRGHAASMALFTGLTALPSQRLSEPDTPELHAFMAGRVAMAEFILDLLSATD